MYKYLHIVSGIFTVIAALHLLRIILDWEAIIGGWTIPIWFSYIAVVVAGYLAMLGCKYGCKK